VTNAKERVALSSIFANGLLTALKLTVGILTGSLGILSEAAHSALDCGATMLTYAAIRISGKPADHDHPYGHGKVESIAALAETALLFLTSAYIIYAASHRLIYGGVEVEPSWSAVGVMAFSMVLDFFRSRKLYKVARETKSPPLEADALHFKSDIYSSGVVLIGLALVYFGYSVGDPIAAFAVALFVLRAGYRLGKETIETLMIRRRKASRPPCAARSRTCPTSLVSTACAAAPGAAACSSMSRSPSAVPCRWNGSPISNRKSRAGSKSG
jgi:cation diffusion facilitator family transporter